MLIRIILFIFSGHLLSQNNVFDSLNSNLNSEKIITNKNDKILKSNLNDSLNKNSKNEIFQNKTLDSTNLDSITIDMYKIIDYQKSIGFVDTTISIQKDYKMNYLRRDYFELLPFSNTGHAYNSIGYNFFDRSVLPQMGARSKHFSFSEKNDIKYFKVPTPLSELFFKTTFEQGQILDALITVNTSPNFNYAIAYRGMRSLGKYINIRSNNSNFKLSFLVNDKSQRYNAKIHYNSQSIINQENGGLKPGSILAFAEGDPDFLDRSLIDNRFNNAENQLTGKRYHLRHIWKIIKENKSPNFRFEIGHEFNYETKSYRFYQNSESFFFGETFNQKGIYDHSKLRKMENKFFLNLKESFYGKLTPSIEFHKSDYSFRSIYYSDSGLIPNKIEPTQIFINSDWEKKISNFYFKVDFKKTIQSDWISDHFLSKIKYNFNNKFLFSSEFGFRSQNPDFNFILYQSDYKNYNWYNPEFKNQRTAHFRLDISNPTIGEISILYQNIDNYTFYKALPSVLIENELSENQLILISQGFIVPQESPDSAFLISPYQENETINYVKIRYKGEYDFGKFSLNNTFQYQLVNSNNFFSTDNLVSKSLNVPKFILRSTISFTSDVFKKAMKLQTGVTAQYFSEYYSDRYNPLVGDFINQEEMTIGGFPRIDFFINAKVQQTRLFLKAEHINSSMTGYNFYSAPNYPYRDFVVRFGIVWNFFQ